MRKRAAVCATHFPQRTPPAVVFSPQQRHLEAVVEIAPEAAAPEPPTPPTLRKRPLIYVYDLPPEYTTRMLQYKVQK